MVYLYGVTHGGYWNNFLTGYSGEMEISPTRELISDLARFPKGTRVGFECTGKQDWNEVNLHLLTLPFNPPESRFGEREFSLRPYYGKNITVYWDKLEKVCSDLGLGVVFLEDKEVWFKYNEAMVKTAENEARRGNLLVVEQRESDEHYDRKRIGFNLERYKEDVSARKIHEIERDNQLLRAIKSSEIDVVFVGIGHSDYWMANPQIIQSNFGLSFEGYSTEVPKMKTQRWEGLTFFVKDAKPNLRNAFVRQGLERTIRLLETGRLSDRKPNLIGTWDINNPLKGYFEMYVNGNGKAIHGEIVDCLGDADFEGEINNREMRFVKKYRQDRCSDVASLKRIVYKGIIRNGNLIGYFVTDGFGQPFYATPKQVKDFIDLGMSWSSSAKKYKTGIKSLGEKLFEGKPTTLTPKKKRCDDEDIPF